MHHPNLRTTKQPRCPEPAQNTGKGSGSISVLSNVGTYSRSRSCTSKLTNGHDMSTHDNDNDIAISINSPDSNINLNLANLNHRSRLGTRI